MEKVPVVFVCSEERLRLLSEPLADVSRVLMCTDQTTYMNVLIHEYVGLVVVDSEWPNWEFFAITPSASSATRRIPIYVIHPEPDQLPQFRKNVDGLLTVAEWQAQALSIFQQKARSLSAETREAIECACQEALPAMAQQAIEKFNAGEYYAQHDLFEALWMQTEGPIRDLYRAILQIGIAYYQIEKGNRRGAIKMLQRSTQWAYLYPAQCQGIEIGRLRDQAALVLTALEAGGETALENFDFSLLQKIEQVP
ncbi:hypothetical protein MASR2M15_26960 [Anaerolineales bacterium]